MHMAPPSPLQRVPDTEPHSRSTFLPLPQVWLAAGSPDMPRTLLVVDDDVNVADFLRESLIERGYEVETFTSPQAALERIISKRFDLVITDLRMPGMAGTDM